MNRGIVAVPHPSDGDLVRYLDTELSELDERRLRSHLRECAQCAERAEAIASQSRAIAGYIGRTTPGGPDAVTRARALASARRASLRPRRAWRPLRLAAAACALLVLALTAQPVRAWISDRWDGLRGTRSSAAEVATLPASIVRRSSVVAFAPRGARFDLQIERFQPDGTLTVEVRDVERATAQVLNGMNETMLILPSGIRVENRAGSRASYLVTVPADLPLLQVSVAGQAIATVDIDDRALPWSRTFPLTAR